MTVTVGYRLANWDTPLWASPNRRESRYGRRGRVVQYWSLHPLTPWAEQLRFHNIRDADEAWELWQRPWAAQLTLPDDVLELSFENAAAHGVAPDALVDDDWSRCQTWSTEFHGSGLMVPSAALPGTTNVVMFGPFVRSRYGLRPLDPTVDLPCDPVAERATVPTDVLGHVRWLGDPHDGYDAWLAGRPAPDAPMVTVGWSE